MSSSPRVYLAGPDVFRIDALEHLRALSDACEDLGLEPLTPSDFVPAWVPDDQIPDRIYENNMELLRSAQGMVANLAPFRGAEPDSGTVFEVGVAIARGMPVIAYGLPPGEYVDRVGSRMPLHRDALGTLRDPDGMAVEDYGRPLNLMLSQSVILAETAEDALRTLAALLGASN
jgi:nucleoside 2-deoxyribosyltransferase